MAKRSKRPPYIIRTAIRLPAESSEYVGALIEQTDWTPPEAIAFLVAVGHAALNRQPEAVEANRGLLEATMRVRQKVRSAVRAKVKQEVTQTTTRPAAKATAAAPANVP